MELIRQRVPEGVAPGTVGRWLSRELGLSVTLVRRLKAADGIRVNGRPARTVDPLAPGDELVLSLPPDPAPNVAPEPVPLDVVHEDDDLIVLDKPPGVVVHPTHGVYGGTLANGLAWRWRERGTPAGIHPLHRLDRQTSGLVLFAKHALAHQRLDTQLQADELERAYMAVVWGEPAAEAGEVAMPIGLRGDHPVARAVRPDGQPAFTSWRVVRRLGVATLLQLVLGTGRTHQIRVHMAAIGHPLVGDTLYGPERPAPIARQALHAATLAFRHPRSDARMRFERPLPRDMTELMARLEARDGSW